MKNLIHKVAYLYICLCVLFVILVMAFIIADFSALNNTIFCPTRAANFGDFFGGFLGTIFSGVSLLFLAYTYKQSQKDRREDEKERRKGHVRENFFRLMQAHTDRVNRTKIEVNQNEYAEGEYAFVRIKLNIHKIYTVLSNNAYDDYFATTGEELKIQKLATAYLLVYYGIDVRWKRELSIELEEIITDKGKREELINDLLNALDPSLRRTMQTTLSSYYRNMFRAIKLVDEANDLSDEEKGDLIKIYRAQLSNPELYIFACNLISKFGQKWEERAYVKTYDLLDNFPSWQFEGIKTTRLFSLQDRAS